MSVKLWHDDVRRPPDDTWTWARTNRAAVALLSSRKVAECSLDHDLGGHEIDPSSPGAHMHKGESDDNGVELVRWMIAADRVPDIVEIHSWNAEGGIEMAALIHAAHIYSVITNRPKITLFPWQGYS